MDQIARGRELEREREGERGEESECAPPVME
jgi:hypothetical protein